jgi:hypothetical protein
MDNWSVLQAAIRALPSEPSIQRSKELLEDAGGDTNHPVWKRLESVTRDLDDAINETVELMENLQAELSDDAEISA